MANTHTTPFVKRMRTQGGTIYTFSSATEDIGLNINELNNIVKISHYALLNIPTIPLTIGTAESVAANYFNTYAIPGALQSLDDSGSIKDGRVVIAESFQNYALNLESHMLDLSTYNATLPTTVAERVFWKWLKETGAIRWEKAKSSNVDVSVNGTLYWSEPEEANYNSVVKAVGQISAGATRNGTFGSYNETYVLVPTSFGQTDVFFKEVQDDNYQYGMKIPPVGQSGGDKILGRESYMKPHPDGLDMLAYYDSMDSSNAIGSYGMEYWNVSAYQPGWWYTFEDITYAARSYYTDIYDQPDFSAGDVDVSLRYTTGAKAGAFKRSRLDCMSIELNLDNLRVLPVWGQNPVVDPTLTFDKMAIEYAIDDNYDFNAVLIYYSVKNKANDTVLATNLLGVMFLDPPSGNTSADILLPSITKLQSGPTGFGTSYSFRLNIKSDYMLDDTMAIVTDSTASQVVLEDFSQVFDGLSKSLQILNQHTGTINYITEQYLDISSTQTNIQNEINDIQYQVNAIDRQISGTENAVPIFQNGDDPLRDSSIYMYRGNVGVFNNKPTFAFQVDGSSRMHDIYVDKAVRDISGNILLGYGSPLQLGASSNYRDIYMYTGNETPAMVLDVCNNLWFGGDTITGFKFSPMVRDTSLAPAGGLRWSAGYLYVDASTVAGGVTAAYVDGSLNMKPNFAYVDGSLARLNASVNTALGAYATNVSVGLALGAYATNASIALAKFVKEASLSTSKFTWTSGFLEPSISSSQFYNPALPDTLLMPAAVGGIPINTSVGGLRGKTFEQLFNDLLFPTVLAYIGTAKSAALNWPTTATVEVGTAYLASATATYSPGQIMNGDGTPDSSVTGNALVYGFKLPDGTIDASYSAISNTQAHSYTPYNVTLGSNIWRIDVSFGAGNSVYYDNKGNVGSNLAIDQIAGNISANSATVSAFRYSWRGYGAEYSAPTDSAGVRALTAVTPSFLSVTNTGSYTITIPALSPEVYFYVPAGKTISVKHVETNVEQIGSFVQTTFNVDDAASVPVSYDSYVQYIGVSGYPDIANYLVTIT